MSALLFYDPPAAYCVAIVRYRDLGFYAESLCAATLFGLADQTDSQIHHAIPGRRRAGNGAGSNGTSGFCCGVRCRSANVAGGGVCYLVDTTPNRRYAYEGVSHYFTHGALL